MNTQLKEKYHTPNVPDDSVLRYIKIYFKYDFETGILYREKYEVKSSIDGYLYTTINYKVYKVHHIVWFLHYGEWPKSQIDHKDRIRKNNRISNLEESNNSKQMINRAYTNKSLYGKGVYQQSGGFRARISYNNKNLHIGFYRNISKAIRARVLAEVNFQNIYEESFSGAYCE